MELYLLRHGIAEDAPPGQPDDTRRLTAAGKKKLRKVLGQARAAGVSPEIVLTSPYVRAVETASIAVDELGLSAKPIHNEVLVPFSDPFAVWEQVRRYGDAESLLLVGHNPLFSHLACFLIQASGGAVEFKKGALARVDLFSMGPQPRGSLVWMLTAKTSGA